MGLVIFALRQKLRAAHHANNLRRLAYDFHALGAIAQLKVLQHIGQHGRVIPRRYKGCIHSELLRRHCREHALICAKASRLAQLPSGAALDFALFRQALQRSIKKHLGVNAGLLEIPQHLILAYALQNRQLT